MPDMIFDNWNALLRTLVLGILSYGFLVLILRITGKRTVSKWNSFDLVVTVALGSSLSTVFFSKDSSLAQGMLGFSVLILLQLIVTRLNVHSQKMQKLTKAKPALFLYKGKFQRQAMDRERVPESEILAAVRSHGIADLEDVGAVVLETDGNFSVIGKLGEATSSLADVTGFQEGS